LFGVTQRLVAELAYKKVGHFSVHLLVDGSP